MFERDDGTGPGRPQRRPVRRARVVRERTSVAARGATASTASAGGAAAASAGAASAGAAAWPVPRLAEALVAVNDALDVLAAVELDGEEARAVLDATVVVQRQANRLAAAQVAMIGRAEESGVYGEDGAASLAAWLRPRTRLDAGECTRRVSAGARLWRFPQLAAAARAGEVTLGHVTAVTSAAVPRRAEAVAAHDATLTLLARHAPPRDVRVAVGRIAAHVDRDGTDRPPEPFDPARPDPRCELWLRPGIDGLGELQATLSQLDTEGLLTLLDALEVPDPPETPVERRRSPAQRRADAFGELIRRALAHGLAPTVHGVKPQVLLALDLAALLPAAQRGELDLADVLAAAGIDEDMLRAAGVDPATLHPTPTDGDDPPDTATDRGADSSHDHDGSGGAQDDAGDPTSNSTGGRTPDHADDPASDPTAARTGGSAQGGAGDPTATRTGGPAGGATGGSDPTGGEGGVHDPTGAPAPSPAPPPDPLTDPPPPEPPPPDPPPPGVVRPRARLRFTGDLDLGSVRRLLLHDATVRCVLTMGPWRPVTVGRAFRTLPAWLRPLLDLVHQRCRGPDCDRPIPWADVHHLRAWSEDGETGVSESIPVCRRHHTLVTSGGWQVRFDPDTGVVTWTSPTGRVYHSRPPP